MSRIPNEWRMVLILCGLATILTAVSFYGGRASGAVITRTRIEHTTLAQEYGNADQSVDGATISSALSGLTCSVYRAKRTVICK